MTKKDELYHLLNDLDGNSEIGEPTNLSTNEKDRLFQTVQAQINTEKKSK